MLTLLKKPRRPVLTPKMGMAPWRTSVAASSTVPSPPNASSIHALRHFTLVGHEAGGKVHVVAQFGHVGLGDPGQIRYQIRSAQRAKLLHRRRNRGKRQCAWGSGLSSR